MCDQGTSFARDFLANIMLSHTSWKQWCMGVNTCVSRVPLVFDRSEIDEVTGPTNRVVVLVHML